MSKKTQIVINALSDDIGRTIKATYGVAGGASIAYRNGYKIMGVIEYETST